jgi:hypothetical protein
MSTIIFLEVSVLSFGAFSRNPLHSTLTLAIARTLVALSRVMVACRGDQLSQMLPPLLSYTWEHLEHVMDSVKHLAVSLLNNIVKLHSSGG